MIAQPIPSPLQDTLADTYLHRAAATALCAPHSTTSNGSSSDAAVIAALLAPHAAAALPFLVPHKARPGNAITSAPASVAVSGATDGSVVVRQRLVTLIDAKSLKIDYAAETEVLSYCQAMISEHICALLLL